MAWPLPADAQTCQGAADASAGDTEVMDLPQMPPQEAIGPARGAIAQLARVTVDHLSDERIDDPQSRWRAAQAWGIGQAGVQVEVGTLVELLNPGGNGAATDAQHFGDPLDGLPGGKPEQGLDTAMFLGEGPISQE